MEIRQTDQADIGAVLDTHARAFGAKAGPVISNLVKQLFEDPTARPLYSFAAVEGSRLSGHILFTKVGLEGTGDVLSCQILAPLAVLPDSQGKGVGQALVRSGLDHLKAAGTDLVFVLGHPGYYPRCGFSPAGVQGFEAPYPIPEKDAGAWMVRELTTGAMGRSEGTVRCARALDRPEHWRE